MAAVALSLTTENSLLPQRNKLRKIAIYLVKILSGAKNPEIRRGFQIKGSAARNAIKDIESQIRSSPDMGERIQDIKRKIMEELS